MKTRRLLMGLLAGMLAGCDNMEHQPNRHFPLSLPPAMQPAAHAVARGQPAPGDPFATGFRDGAPLVKSPLPFTGAVLARGCERFNIYCAVCHGADGYGAGIVVRRGFPAPPSYHDERLRKDPDGHFFDVITRGYGVMPSYADRISAADRWAITGYIRALQLSQHATFADVPVSARGELSKP